MSAVSTPSTSADATMLAFESGSLDPAGESFDAMIQRRPDLLDHRNGAVAQCYSKAQLDSPEARRVFMLPASPNQNSERGTS